VKVDSCKYARFGVRVASGAVDLAVLGLTAAVLSWLGIEVQTLDLETRADLYQAIVRLWREALLAPVIILAAAAMAFSWMKFLATPGQLLMGCRVVRRKRNAPLSPPVALWRAACMLLLAAPTAIPLLTMFFDRQRRAAHDWLSDSTVVVEDESRPSLEEWLSELG
jgi:uncharacterized RDD family membrane protein YckC